MTRHPTWPEIRDFLQRNLAQAYTQLETADVPEIYRLQAEARHCRMLLAALEALPLQLDYRDEDAPREEPQYVREF